MHKQFNAAFIWHYKCLTMTVKGTFTILESNLHQNNILINIVLEIIYRSSLGIWLPNNITKHSKQNSTLTANQMVFIWISLHQVYWIKFSSTTLSKQKIPTQNILTNKIMYLCRNLDDILTLYGTNTNFQRWNSDWIFLTFNIFNFMIT